MERDALSRLRSDPRQSAELVDELLDAVVSDLPFSSGDRVALMINGLGGTPISELYLLYGIAHEKLEALGITIARNYVGEYCTSLDMAGASLTLVKLDPEIDELLAATDSKYSLVIYAAKRARQINAYYSQLGEGLLEYVGPLVETRPQEKPLSIAMREINEGLLTSQPTEG